MESGIQLKESGIPLTIGIRNPSSTDTESVIQYLKSGIHRCGIQNPRLSWITLYGAKRDVSEKKETYRKIPKISPEAYIFQRPFLRGLFLEGPIFGGAYVRREICVIKSVGLACSGKEI